MLRSFGCTSLTTRPLISSSPDVTSSSPAIIRKSVDLPQPDGPTNTTNSPSWISRFASFDHLDRAKAFAKVAECDGRHRSGSTIDKGKLAFCIDVDPRRIIDNADEPVGASAKEA